MNQQWERTPISDAQLFDLLSRLFGYGTYDDAVSDTPFWQYRMKEITKVAASRKKANCSLLEATRIAKYCKQTGVAITGPAQLWKYRADARRWWQQQLQAEREAQLDAELREAIAIEFENPHSNFLDRMLRASGDYRKEVLAEWKRSRSSRPENPTASSARRP